MFHHPLTRELDAYTKARANDPVLNAEYWRIFAELLPVKLASYLIRYLPYDTTLAVLELWAQARCAQTPDPWGPDDVEAKLRSAVSYEGGQS